MTIPKLNNMFKRINTMLLPMVLTVGAAISMPGSAAAEKAAAFAGQGMNVSVEFYTSSIVRVLKTPDGGNKPAESLAVIKTPDNVAIEKSEKNGVISLRSDRLTVNVNPVSGGTERTIFVDYASATADNFETVAVADELPLLGFGAFDHV